jgi:hypothetical protein
MKNFHIIYGNEALQNKSLSFTLFTILEVTIDHINEAQDLAEALSKLTPGDFVFYNHYIIICAA